MDVEITKTNGDKFKLSDYGVHVTDFIVSSLPMKPLYGEIEGRHGTVDYGATYEGQRTITVPFYIRAKDSHDFPLMRDMIFQLINDTEPFFVRELRKLNENNRFVGGKRYLVRLGNTFTIDQSSTVIGFGEFVFETTKLPFAESIGTTQDIHKNGINADDELWGFGMGLEAVDESLIYTHNATVDKPFFIYNAGNVSIHPFEQDFKMTIRNVQGSTDMFQITNLTNGSRARINVPVKPTDTIVYDGPNVTRNGLAFLRDTQKNFIELSPGWNSFRVHYCDSADIEFDFRYYYL